MPITARSESPLQQAAGLHDSAAFCHAGGNHRRAGTLRLRALELIKRHEDPGHPDAAVVLGIAESFPVSEPGSATARYTVADADAGSGRVRGARPLRRGPRQVPSATGTPWRR